MNRNYIMKKKQKFKNPVTSEEGKPIMENLLTKKSFNLIAFLVNT